MIVLSGSVSRDVRRIVNELDRKGIVTRSGTELWRGRIHNAARRAGFIVETERQGGVVVGRVVGWR